MGGVQWPFNFGPSSTPPVYQHPAVTPPIYQHGALSTTPPTYNFPYLFSGGNENNFLSGMFGGSNDGSEVLDVLWQPTPPNTYAGILMARQQQQQYMMQQQKEEKEKQARSSVAQ
jgi:hypothetical protein